MPKMSLGDWDWARSEKSKNGSMCIVSAERPDRRTGRDLLRNKILPQRAGSNASELGKADLRLRSGHRHSSGTQPQDLPGVPQSRILPTPKLNRFAEIGFEVKGKRAKTRAGTGARPYDQGSFAKETFECGFSRSTSQQAGFSKMYF